MRIISWNCNGALRKKIDEVDRLDADIIVIQECENPEHSTKSYREWAGDFLWVGKNKNKGLGVFSKNGHSLSKLNWTGEYKQPINHPKHIWPSEKLESFLPCLIDNEIPLLAVWTKKADSPNFGYIGQLWMYLQIHRSKLGAEKQIVCGDLNSNSIWDSWDRWWNHSDVISEFDQLGLKSVYHFQNNEDQGEETQPSFFLQRKLEKTYHIDYFFMNEKYLSKTELSILDKEMWLKLSDHLPLVLNVVF